MNPLTRNILPLLFLLFSLACHSFAVDELRDSLPEETHLLTIQEYCQCLMAVASTEDPHGLYDATTMNGEIMCNVSERDPHFLYGIAHGIDPQSPVHGLTELNAMRCCNWLETSLSSKDAMPPNTEIGSYVIHEDGSFQMNDQAQLHLLPHDDGTFEIVSKVVKEKSAPLMMVGKLKGKDFHFPQFNTAEKTAVNRRKTDTPSSGSQLTDYQENTTVSNMNITLPSLAPIFHNDNVEDDSLIGHTGVAGATDGNYVAIKDQLACCPKVIRAYLTPEETRQQIQAARQQLRADLKTAMSASNDYKKKDSGRFSLSMVSNEKINQQKIDQDLQKFDQFFTDHDLTRGTLEQFCQAHGITVPEPPTGRIPKAGDTAGSSVYGSIENLGKQVVDTLQRLTDDKEEESFVPTETTPLRKDPRWISLEQPNIDKTRDLADKTRELVGNAASFNKLAAELEKQQKEQWFSGWFSGNSGSQTK